MRLVLFVLSTLFFASAVNAADPVKRLPDGPSVSKGIGVIVKYREGIVTTQGLGGPGGTRVFNVDSDEAEAFAARLERRPEVEAVALDRVTDNPPLEQPVDIISAALGSESGDINTEAKSYRAVLLVLANTYRR